MLSAGTCVVEKYDVVVKTLYIIAENLAGEIIAQVTFMWAVRRIASGKRDPSETGVMLTANSSSVRANLNPHI